MGGYFCTSTALCLPRVEGERNRGRRGGKGGEGGMRNMGERRGTSRGARGVPRGRVREERRMVDGGEREREDGKR